MLTHYAVATTAAYDKRDGYSWVTSSWAVAMSFYAHKRGWLAKWGPLPWHFRDYEVVPG